MSLSWRNNYDLLVFDKIDSTNSEAIRLAKAGIKGNHVIFAHSQINGRGRHGKVWESRAGNLHISLLLNENIPIKLQSQLSFVTAVALHETINSLSQQYNVNLNIKLKWPNDLLVGNKKIAGILLESLKFMNTNSLIIGVGINVNHFPNVEQPTTSLLNEKITITPEKLIDVLMINFNKYFLNWQAKGFSEIRNNWLKNAAKLGELIAINDGNNKIFGIFKGIDLEGNIRIETANAKIINISTGQVFFGKNKHE